MATTYSFKTLEEGHIRVLTIVGPDLPLQCNLVHVPIEDAGQYDALSYVWGSSDRTEFIICDGQRLDVTSNLYSALCQITKNRMPWTVWIDGICIDQQNDEEKAIQVGCMDIIYSTARCVRIWLGSAGHESDLAIQAIEDMVLPSLVSPFVDHSGSCTCSGAYLNMWRQTDILGIVYDLH
jgi:hypothetical protein